MVTVISEKTVKARKAHRCGFCNMQIDPGTRYNLAFLVYDEPYTWREHLHCRELANKIIDWSDLDDCGCSADDFKHFVVCEWERINNKSSLGVSYMKIFDEVLIFHKIKGDF